MGGIFQGGITAGALTATGPYVLELANRPSVPQGPASNTLAIVGTSSDGPFNQPTLVSMQNGAGQICSLFGTNTSLPNSIIRSALSASPECTSIVVVRVTDGTDAAAVCNIQDSQATPATVLVLTAINHGTEANNLTASVALQSGTASSSPVYAVTVNYPNNNRITYSGIIGYATVGGAYAAATFQANAIAAINGTAANSVASPFVVASAGSSTSAPNVAATFQATGGADGATSVTSSVLQGTDGTTGRTGMYALRGTSFGGLLLSGSTDLTTASNMAAFLGQTGGLGFVSIPSGTTTAAAIASKNTNNVSNQRIIACMDWCYVNDPLSKTAQKLVSPAAVIAGIVMALPPWKSPANKPVAGKVGINGTERTINAQPVDPNSEGALREQNNITWLTNQNIGAGGVFRLPHGQASDGSNISDTRMLDFIAVQVLQILGQSVGESQTPPPTNGAPDQDATRNAALGRLVAFFDTLNPAVEGRAHPRIYAASVRFTGTPTQVQQGYLPFGIDVTTLSGVRYALATLQVGNTVWIPNAT